MMPSIELCMQTYWAQMACAFCLGAAIVGLIALIAWPHEVRQ